MNKILILIILIFSSMSFGSVFTYRSIFDETVQTNNVEVVSMANGYSIRSKAGNTTGMEMETDIQFAELKLKLTDDKLGMDIIAKREGDSIAFSGIYKGKKYDKKIKIDNNPWYEAWGTGLSGFAVSTDKSSVFWSVNPSDLNMVAKFKANKLGVEKITVNNSEIEAVHVKVSLTGLMESFFSCDYWFRISDGREVLSKIPRGPGKSPVIIELINEEI